MGSKAKRKFNLLSRTIFGKKNVKLFSITKDRIVKLIKFNIRKKKKDNFH